MLILHKSIPKTNKPGAFCSGFAISSQLSFHSLGFCGNGRCRFVYHRGFGGADGDVGVAYAHIQGSAVLGGEDEGLLVTGTGPVDGDDLATVGVVAGAAGVEVSHKVDAVGGDVGVHNQHVGEHLGFAGDLVGHYLAVLIIYVLVRLSVIGHDGFLLGLSVGEGQRDLTSVLAVSRGAVLSEGQTVIPLQAHGIALGLCISLDAGADTEEGIFISTVVLGIPVGGTLGGNFPSIDVKVFNAPVGGILQCLAGATGMGQNQIIVLGQLVEDGPGGSG